MFYDNFVRLSVRKGILPGILDTVLARFWHEKNRAFRPCFLSLTQLIVK